MSKLKNVACTMGLLLAASVAAWGQCGHFAKISPVMVANGPLFSVPLPSVRVCSEPASGTTCTPLANIYSDFGCTQALSNPMTGDAQGNVDFYSTSPNVHLQINASVISQIDIANVALFFLAGNQTAPAHQFANALNNLGVLSFAQPAFADISGTIGGGQLPAGVVFNNQSNLWTTGTQDFSSVTLMRARVGAGLTTSVNGDFGYDSTNKNWHLWDNGVDAINVVVPAASLPTTGDCAKWSVVGGVLTLVDSGNGACIGASPPGNATQSINGGLSVGGPLTSGSVNGNPWVGTAPGQFTIGGCQAALPSSGGTCEITSGYSETLSGNLTFNKSNVRYHTNGPCTITQGTNQVIFTAPLSGFTFEGPGIWGASAASAPCTFIYTGNSAAWAIDTSANNTNNVQHSTFKNFKIDISGGGNSAIGWDSYGMSLSRLENVLVVAAATQTSSIGVRMNGNALTDGEGNILMNVGAANAHTGIQYNQGSAPVCKGQDVWIMVAAFQPGTAGNVGVDLESACMIHAMRTDVSGVGAGTGIKLGGTTNGIQSWGTTDETSGGTAFNFGASTIENEFVGFDIVGSFSDSGTRNVVRKPGGLILSGVGTLLNGQEQTSAFTGNSADQVFYTYTMPANTMAAGKAVNIKVFFETGSSSDTPTIKLFFGATTCINGVVGNTTGNGYYMECTVFNNSGVTNAQQISNIQNFSTVAFPYATFAPVTSATDTTRLCLRSPYCPISTGACPKSLQTKSEFLAYAGDNGDYPPRPIPQVAPSLHHGQRRRSKPLCLRLILSAIPLKNGYVPTNGVPFSLIWDCSVHGLLWALPWGME
jgi:hypothetical protein